MDDYEEYWDDAEEYERDELAQDHEDEDEDQEYGVDDDPREDFGYFGEAGLWD